MLSLLLIEAIKGAAVGGVIGWTTNWVAVRMLFRPRGPWRLFGMQVPLTPGLVVKNKDRLADAIGSAVARDLLDPQTLLEHLRQVDLQEPIVEALRQERRDLLLIETTIAGKFGEEHREALETIRERLAPFLAAKVAELAGQAEEGDPAFEATLRAALGGLVDEPLASHLSEEQRADLRSAAVARLKELAAREEAGSYLEDAARKALRAFPESAAFATLEKLAGQYLEGRIPAVVVGLQESLADYVEGESFAARAQTLIASKLHSMITDKFPMARMLVTDKLMADLVTQAWPDLLAELQDIARGDDLQQFLSAQIDNGARNFLESVREAVTDEEATEKAAAWVTEEARKGATGALDSEKGAGAVGSALDAVLAKSPRQLIAQIDVLLAGVTARLAREAGKWLRSEDGRRWVQERAARAIDDLLFQQPVRSLVEALPEHEWNRASHFLGAVLEERALRAIPDILSNKVDLQTLVSRKIDDFETSQLEEIIDRVSGRELKGIVRLGGLIGIFVGATTQVAFFFLR